MLTLAVDTTAEFGSVALADESGVREEVLLHEPAGFSGVLFGQIGALLQRQNVDVRQIEMFAGASGPGSFTGVRVGLAAVKGLAEVLARPAAAVSNLEALALFGNTNARATVIDARRGEIYGALFDGEGQSLIPETVVAFPLFLKLLEQTTFDQTTFEWICADFAPFLPALAGTPFERMPVRAAPRALAGAIAQLAICRLAQGDPCEAASIEANYVRRSDAELLWKY
jgi:tRNA threonylcarbamoyladenosine biosynthesis protein TsaB